MFNANKFLLSIIVCAIIPISTYANFLILTIKTSALNANYQHPTLQDWKLNPTIQDKLKAENQRQINLLIDLKNKISKLDLTDKDKITNNLSSLIDTKQKTNVLDNKDGLLNFLNLQLQDAYSFLTTVSLSAKTTNEIVTQMNALAVQAACGVYSANQLANMDLQYQGYKSVLRYIQTIDLFNGEKKLSGGDITIQLGDNAGEQNRLVINLPAFDVTGLALENSSINSQANAQEAIETTLNAEKIISTVITKISLGLNDATSMMLTAAHMLREQFEILYYIRDLSLESANGTLSNDQRINLDDAFTYAKSTMTQSQTYVSLDGPKKLGGGNLHIQVGKYATPETILDIKIPVTDVAKLGLDKLDIKSQESAETTITALVDNIHHFVYGTQG